MAVPVRSPRRKPAVQRRLVAGVLALAACSFVLVGFDGAPAWPRSLPILSGFTSLSPVPYTLPEVIMALIIGWVVWRLVTYTFET